MTLRPTLLRFLLLAGPIAFFAGCRKDPAVPPEEQPGGHTGTLRVTVIPEWQGDPLQFYHEYRNIDDYRTTVEALKIYWSDVQLINGLESMPVSRIELFDLQNGPFTRDWKVAPGTWTGLRTGIGVPEDLNHTDPALYGADHPLSINNGTHWGWAAGYIFVTFGGRYDPDPASTAPLEVFAYGLHTGMDTCYATVDLIPVLPITIAEDSVTNVTVRVAVDEFFHSNFGTIDLATEFSSHGNNVPLAMKLTRNVLESMEIE